MTFGKNAYTSQSGSVVTNRKAEWSRNSCRKVNGTISGLVGGWKLGSLLLLLLLFLVVVVVVVVVVSAFHFNVNDEVYIMFLG